MKPVVEPTTVGGLSMLQVTIVTRVISDLMWVMKNPGYIMLRMVFPWMGGTSKSSILIVFSLINHPFWAPLGYSYPVASSPPVVTTPRGV